jgi:ABC-type glutathione transport system ATPase component
MEATTPAMDRKGCGSQAATAVTPVVQFQNVSLAFDDRIVLCDVSFSVRPGAMTILLGASGAGKTVVLKLILGLLRPDGGTILVNGHRIDNMPESDLLLVRADTRDDIVCRFRIGRPLCPVGHWLKAGGTTGHKSEPPGNIPTGAN